MEATNPVPKQHTRGHPKLSRLIICLSAQEKLKLGTRDSKPKEPGTLAQDRTMHTSNFA